MRCWDDRDAVEFHAELGASAAILAAGFNLDCFLSRSGPKQKSALQAKGCAAACSRTCPRPSDAAAELAVTSKGLGVVPPELKWRVWRAQVPGRRLEASRQLQVQHAAGPRWQLCAQRRDRAAL